MPDDDRSSEPGAVALSIAAWLRRLDPGPLATLRRLDPDGAAPAFWRLAARHDLLARQPARWSPVVRALAILTPKGAPEERPDLHDPGRPLGMALCDGGDPGWPGAGPPRPMLSERRLAQILAARGTARELALVRALRALAARRPSASGLRVPDVAWAFLNPADPGALAAPYYRRLDRAEGASAKADREMSPNPESAPADA